MLRLFAEKDLNRVMDIWLAGNLQAHPFVPEDYWRSQASRVREVINEAEVLVWEESGQIMGFLGMWGEHIEGAKERKPALALHVYQDNVAAVAFYHRRGFSVVSGGTDPETGQPEWVMRWTR